MTCPRMLRVSLLFALACVCFTAKARAVGTPTFFDVIAEAGSAGEFKNLFTFDPAGHDASADDGRMLVARILVPSSDVTGLQFKLAFPVGSDFSSNQFSPTSSTSVTSGAQGPVATNSAFVPPGDPVFTGFTIVVVVVTYTQGKDFSTAGTWTLQVERQSAPDRRYTGCYLDDVDNPNTPAAEVGDAVTLGRLEAVQHELNFQGVHVMLGQNVAPVSSVSLQNIGTAPLTPSSGLSLSATDAFDVGKSATSFAQLKPGEILVSEFKDATATSSEVRTGVNVMCHPQSMGDQSAELTLNPGNVPVTLKCVGVLLYAHMLFDLSGSMSFNLAGDHATDPQSLLPSCTEEETRLHIAKEAGKGVLEWVNRFSGGNAWLGLSSFPQSDGPNNSEIEVPIDKVMNTYGTIVDKFQGVDDQDSFRPTWLGTPMADGLDAAASDMNSHESAAAGGSTPVQLQQLKKAVLMLSDGAANIPTGNGPQAARDRIVKFQQHDIKVFTIGLGDVNGNEVDWGLLHDIATQTGGQEIAADTSDPLNTWKAFKAAVKDWLNLRTIVDPAGQIRSGQTKDHTVCVDASDYGLTFVVNWSPAVGENDEGISLQLTTPSGITITPTTSGIIYKHGQTYAMYVLQGRWARAGQGKGQWTMHLTGSSGLSSTNETQYSYDVLAQSPIHIKPNFKWEVLSLARPYLMQIDLKDVPDDRIGQVTVDYDLPAQSFNKWLCKTPVDARLIVESRATNEDDTKVGLMRGLVSDAMAKGENARDVRSDAQHTPATILGERATLAQKKAYVLSKILKEPFPNQRTTGKITLYDDGTHDDAIANDRVFTASAPEFAHDGMYSFRVGLGGKTGIKQCFQGELWVNRFIGAKLTASLSSKHVKWGSAKSSVLFDRELTAMLGKPAPDGMERKMIRFEPQGENGTLWGLDHASEIKFECRDCDLVGSVQDNLDGSYSQLVQYARGASPRVAVTAQGVTSWDVPMHAASGNVPWYIWVLVAMGILTFLMVYRIAKRTSHS